MDEKKYSNPIIHSDYSDPDAIKYGDGYIMVSSSFCSLPGLPILVSDDLVNWELKNYAVKNIPFKEFDKPNHDNGIWAPSIRYQNGKYWIYFGMPDHGIFMIQAEDPLGEWSEPVCVKQVKGWIDPCPLWDDDGNAYLVSALAKSRAGVNSKLILSRLSLDGTKVLDEGVEIFDGTENHPIIEGPKFYKKNNYYYIFAPAGGVATGWQTVLRAENIYGPYEDKIVLHQGKTEINGPHQGALIENDFGESWFLHFQEVEVYGRILHLQPVVWEDDWPKIGENFDENGIGEPVKIYCKPKSKSLAFDKKEIGIKDDFDKEKLELSWQWFSNLNVNFYSLLERENYIRLYAIGNNDEKSQSLWETGNLMLQKFPYPEFEVETYFEFNPQEIGDISGVITIGENYSSLYIEKENNKYFLNHIISFDEERVKKEKNIEKIEINTNKIYLKVKEKGGGKCEFYYSLTGEAYKKLNNEIEIKKSIWIGNKIGIFSMNKKGILSCGYSDFDYFTMK